MQCVKCHENHYDLICSNCDGPITQMKWIKCEDQTPKLGIKYRYLFINGKGDVTYGYAYDWEKESDRYVCINDMDRETNEIATHWMPLPEKPE
jgi:hypothetical protein